MDTYNSLFAFGSILSGLANLVILVATVILLFKRRNLATIIIFIGWFSHSLVFLFGFIANIFAARIGSEELVFTNALMTILNGITVLIFSIGLLIFFIQIKKQKTDSSQGSD
ncbi:MAG: hypothetical protein KJO41_03610 [Bacteroidia bacterium]|nr:hypothetical protein [Bacteroidia bacterium]NND26306.1 hypothetical protein [Flavobacteriaceae bacterium]MBT8278063.1 hypothetical protein [Bacteroidia bacterium]NNK59575.1 hypothetical protein [Flavobacteriaceae bacterium]NNL33988.1 hypothetical protein [Flavobacteriaceae bacterium]